MPVTTASAAFHIAPVVVKNFFSHGERKASRLRNGKREDLPQDDIFYDQAFNIVKSFIRMVTHNTIESLQSFTNAHVPSSHRVTVAPTIVPLSSCNTAADLLAEWFGPDELRRVVGGHKWWQVRGLDGIEAEWITDKKYLSRAKGRANEVDSRLSRHEDTIVRMDHLEPVMLYIHGGGYFWGSMNTHRYQIIRYAREFRGRAFTVNYRKAPQYPWPCAIQDVLAAYFYLTEPPKNAPHKPVSPNKITLAGDSAGGGLCLALLTILRDLDRPLPAGAVLISPWVDLTHSFPSILENGESDIIPEHGFLSKPSTLWPLDLLPPEGGRVAPTETNPPPMPGDADTLKPSESRLSVSAAEQVNPKLDRPVQPQEIMLGSEQVQSEARSINEAESFEIASSPSGPPTSYTWEPKPPKLLMQDPKAIPLELRSQIQLYATTEQVTHPLVSPVFQGSLGNLPPLYIIAGDGELLRDEIIYLAHRAAYPRDYPARNGILRDMRRQEENVERFTTGTKVHFQLFDGMCHVPTVFTFCSNARYAYRSIAAFVVHITQLTTEELERMPFPEPRAECLLSTKPSPHEEGPGRKRSLPGSRRSAHDDPISVQERTTPNRLRSNQEDICVTEGGSAICPAPMPAESRSQNSSPAFDHMRRERVNIHGQIRPMEPAKEIPALNIQAGDLGILKEAPVMMWKNGQDKWDRRYKQVALSAAKKRRRLEVRAEKLLRNAFAQGLLHSSQSLDPSKVVQDEDVAEHLAIRPSVIRQTSVGEIQTDRRWGPLDLEDESPPHSAIAKRRDTPEALALLKKHIYSTAPVTHLTVPKMKHADALRASIDPHDDPNRPPRQSASEQQQKALPLHGLRLWDNILMYFGRKSAAKAANGTKLVGEAVKDITSTIVD